VARLQLLLLDRIQHDVLDSVRSGEVDFGVVIDPGEREDLHCEPILSEPFCLVCPPGHRLAQRPRVGWRELAGESLVLLDHASGSRRLIDRALDAQGWWRERPGRGPPDHHLPHGRGRPGHLGGAHAGPAARGPRRPGGARAAAARGPRHHAGAPAQPRADTAGADGLGTDPRGGGRRQAGPED
jgi:DNA-binding transcriptional LysR family regulator